MANDIILVGTVSSVESGQSGYVAVTGTKRDNGTEEPINDKRAYYGKFFKGQRATQQDLGKRVVVTTQPYGEKATLYVQDIAFDPAPGVAQPAPQGGHLTEFAKKLGGVPINPQENPEYFPEQKQIPNPFTTEVTSKDTLITLTAIAKSYLESGRGDLDEGTAQAVKDFVAHLTTP